MYLCLNCQNRLHSTRCSGFGSLMNIDKLIPQPKQKIALSRFGSLMNIDKLIQPLSAFEVIGCFGSLMNIDKLIHIDEVDTFNYVLAL